MNKLPMPIKGGHYRIVDGKRVPDEPTATKPAPAKPAPGAADTAHPTPARRDKPRRRTTNED